MSMSENELRDERTFFAFISYSHSGASDGASRDGEVAAWLQRELERFVVPRELVGSRTRVGVVPTRLGHVFRDENYAPAAEELGEAIENALRRSQNLIVVCSPRAAASRWVEREINYFKTNSRNVSGESMLVESRRVFALIVDGDPKSTEDEERCFPSALLEGDEKPHEASLNVLEPLAPDIRKDGRERALSRLISGLLGLDLEDLVRSEERRQIAQRRRARLIFSAGVFLVLVATLGIIGVLSLGSKNADARLDLLASFAQQALSNRQPGTGALLALSAVSSHSNPTSSNFRTAPHRVLYQSLLKVEALEFVAEQPGIELRDIQFSPDGNLLLVDTAPGHFAVWSWRKGIKRFEIPSAAGDPDAYDSMFLSGGGSIAAFSNRGLTVYSSVDGSITLGPVAMPNIAKGAIVSPTSDYIAIPGNPCLLWSQGQTFEIGGCGQEEYRYPVLAFSEDESLLVYVQTSGTVVLVDSQTQSIFWSVDTETSSPFKVEFSKDGEYVFAASLTGFDILRTTDGSVEASVESTYGPILDIALAADQKHLITAHPDGSVAAYLFPKGFSRWISPSATGYITDLAASNDSNKFAIADRNGHIEIGDVATGRMIDSFEASSRSINSLNFSEDDRFLASAGADNRVLIWKTNLRRKRCAAQRPLQMPAVRQIAWGHSIVAIVSTSGRLEIYDAKSCDRLSISGESAGKVLAATATNVGADLIALHSSGNLHTHDTSGSTRLAGFAVEDPNDPILTRSTEGDVVVVANGPIVYSIRIDRAEARLVGQRTFKSDVSSIGVTESGERIYVGLRSGAILSLSIGLEERNEKSIDTGDELVDGFAASEADSIVAAALKGGRIAVWYLANSTVQFLSVDGDRRVLDLKIVEHVDSLAVLTDDSDVTFYKLDTLEPIAEYEDPWGFPYISSLSPDASAFAEMDSRDEELAIWDVPPLGEDLRRITCENLPVGRKRFRAEEVERHYSTVLDKSDRTPCSEREGWTRLLRSLGLL